MKILLFILLISTGLFAQDAIPNFKSDADHNVWIYAHYKPELTKPELFLQRQYLDFKKYLHTDQVYLDGVGLSAMFLAGATRGLHETLVNHYSYFKREYPYTNDQWWDPSESWKNKYVDNDVNKGRNLKPIFLTDAYHLTNAIEKYSTISGSMILVIGERHKPLWYLKKFTLGCLAYQAGFTSTYTIKFHK